MSKSSDLRRSFLSFGLQWHSLDAAFLKACSVFDQALFVFCFAGWSHTSLLLLRAGERGTRRVGKKGGLTARSQDSNALVSETAAAAERHCSRRFNVFFAPLRSRSLSLLLGLHQTRRTRRQSHAPGGHGFAVFTLERKWLGGAKRREKRKSKWKNQWCVEKPIHCPLVRLSFQCSRVLL